MKINQNLTTAILLIATPLPTVYSQQDDNAGNLLELPAFEATAQQNPVEFGMPTVSVKLDEIDFQKINFINPEDALKYSPNINIRKRFIGDQNGVLSIRGNSVFQNARTLVFADGVNLTDLLFNRWNGSPKWQMVSPDEVHYVEVYYGPYSAQYSGNSMNGVVNYFTKLPNEKNNVIRASYFSQSYKAYNTEDQFNGYKGFASFGNRSGKFSYYGFYQRLENDSQPQSFVRKFSPGVADGSETTVTGVIQDLDPGNRDRAVLGAVSFNETKQDLFKFKGAYDFSEDMRGQFTVGFWDTIDDTTRVENYLRDGSGNTVWSGDVGYDGLSVNTRSSDWRTRKRDRENLLFGATLEGALENDWDFQTYFTYYGILDDRTLTSDEHPEDPTFDGSGRVQDYGDTGWFSYDFKIGQDGFLDNEKLSIFAGLHYSRYEYSVDEFNSTDFANGLKDGSRRNGDGGQTATPALYAQADYDLAEKWTATFGARAEYWRATDGRDYSGGITYHHPVREEEDISPKFSLAYKADENWDVRLSLAKAVRYPLVSELFVGDPDERSTVINNPTLNPAEVFAKTLIFERLLEDGMMRVAFFHNDETETIFRQRAATPSGSLTTFVNIDEVLTQGVEFSLQRSSILFESLDIAFNASYNDTEIQKNSVDPSIVGNEIPRVPQWRVNLLATYHFSPKLDFSLGFRHADGAFDDLANSESNHDTYEGISSFNVWDAKATYQLDDGLVISAGIDNIFDEEYWMHHPFPQRTFFVDAKWSF